MQQYIPYNPWLGYRSLIIRQLDDQTIFHFFSFGRQDGDPDGDGSQHRHQPDQHPGVADAGRINWFNENIGIVMVKLLNSMSPIGPL